MSGLRDQSAARHALVSPSLRYLPMTLHYRLTLVLALTVLCSGCAEGLSNLPWNKTETTKTSKKVPPPNNQIGRWGTLETTTTCVTSYIGSEARSRNCSVAEKYIPPPEKTYSGGFFERLAKGLLDDVVGGALDATVDRLRRPDAPPPSDTPTNMTVLPPAEAASAPAAQRAQDEAKAPEPVP